MHRRTRCTGFVALAASAVLTLACGGQAADQPPAGNQPAGKAEPATEATPAPAPEATTDEPAEPAQPAAPAQPQLTGNIVDLEHQPPLEWLSAATRENPGKYRWTVELRNDTTQTLDITVRFDFLDEAEKVIKTDRKTVRVAPADTATVTNEGEMPRDQARAVVYTSYTWEDWKIVSSER